MSASAGATVIVLLLTIGTPVGATDLRGRVDARNPVNGAYQPLPNARVELMSQGRVAMRTLTGFDGFYYFRNAGPGSYDIVVNGRVSVGTTIHPGPYQDLPPILFAPR
jgi:hypothetical protein